MKMWACVVVMIAALGCGTETIPAPGRAAGAAEGALDTFIGDRSIQIDLLTAAGDANLFAGPDPADGTASVDLPPGPGVFIDWDDLGGNLAEHQIQDLDVGGRDPSSFPRSNECVGVSGVLSKMDLTYVAAASNDELVYFAVQRSDNSGDAGYYWLFTKKPPLQQAGAAPCKTAETRLLYDLSPGDVLLAGHFKPSASEPLLQVLLSKKSAAAVPATAAIDFTDASQWGPAPDAITVAVNTTITDPGSLGAAGVKALAGADLGAELFAESAVPLSVFTGGPACGATLFGSVITRSSGAGGTSPDLKDLSGPAAFNFGPVTATAVLAGSCDGSLGFAATVAEGAGAASCAWTFVDAGGSSVGASSDCSGSLALPPGTYTGTVSVATASGCSAAAVSASAEVAAPISVSLELAAAAQSCPDMASDAAVYEAVVSGGLPPYSFAWSGAPCVGSSCAIDPADGDFCAAASISVAVDDASPLCPAVSSEVETYSKVTIVEASNN